MSTLDGYILPPLPSSMAEVLEIVAYGDPGNSMKRLVRVAESDPALSAYVLRRVNSPFYGLSRHVESVEKAVHLLGGKTVCEVALEAGLKQSFPFMETATGQNIYNLIVSTSIASGKLTKTLASELRLPHSNMAFLVGLLHQIGRMVLLQTKETSYAALWYRLSDDVSTEEEPEFSPPELFSEKREIGITHIQAGTHVASHWHLPDLVETCIRHQARPEDATPRPAQLMVYVVRVASLWSYAPVLETPADQETSGAFFSALEGLATLRKQTADDLVSMLRVAHEDAHSYAQEHVA